MASDGRTINIVNTVPEILKSCAGERLKARDLAERIKELYPKACAEKLRRSAALKTEPELIQQIVAEIGATRPRIQKLFPQVRTTEGRPRRYYWSEKSDEVEVAEAEAVETLAPLPDPGSSAEHRPNEAASSERLPPPKMLEYALYPILSSYLASEFGVATMRIDEKRATNSRGPHGNRWLFPDLVGLQDLTHGWHPELKQCVSQTGDARAKLWSFEVKRLLNRSNVREVFFQTVSNSSC